MNPTCIDPDPSLGPNRRHAWSTTGLDNHPTLGLVNTRRCSWCGRAEHKRYGAGGSHSWKQDT